MFRPTDWKVNKKEKKRNININKYKGLVVVGMHGTVVLCMGKTKSVIKARTETRAGFPPRLPMVARPARAAQPPHPLPPLPQRHQLGVQPLPMPMPGEVAGRAAGSLMM